MGGPGGGGGATSWTRVRLSFTDGARVDLLAVVCEGRVSIEDGSEDEGGVGCPAAAGHRAEEPFGARRARPVWPRGVEGAVAGGAGVPRGPGGGGGPRLAVMCATGHSRRRSLRLIAQACDAGYLTPRHARR
ncbi:DUF6214 family protein [Streptomyces sp. NPDC054884]